MALDDSDKQWLMLRFLQLEESLTAKINTLQDRIDLKFNTLDTRLFDEVSIDEYGTLLYNFQCVQNDLLYIEEQIDNINTTNGNGGVTNCNVENIVGQLQGDIVTYFGITNSLINDTKQAIEDKDCCPTINEYEQVTIDAQPWNNPPITYYGLAPLTTSKIINKYDDSNEWVSSTIEIYDKNNDLVSSLIKHGDHSPYGALESFTAKFEPWNNYNDSEEVNCEYFDKLLSLMYSLLREIRNKDNTDTDNTDLINLLNDININLSGMAINLGNNEVNIGNNTLAIENLIDLSTNNNQTIITNLQTIEAFSYAIHIDIQNLLELSNDINFKIGNIILPDNNLEIDLNPVLNAILDLKNHIDISIGGIVFNPILNLLNDIDIQIKGIDLKLDFKPILDFLHDINITIKGIEANLNIDLSPIINLINNMEFSINNKIEIKGNEVIEDIDKNVKDVGFYTKPMFEKKAFINDIYLSIDWEVIGSKSRYPDRIVLNPDLTLDWNNVWENILLNLTWRHGEIYAHIPANDKTVSICSGYFYDNEEAIKVLTTLGNLSTLEKLNDTDFIRFNSGASKKVNATHNTKISKMTCYSLVQDKILFSYTRNKGKIV